VKIQLLDLIVIVVYLIAITSIGFYFKFKAKKSNAEYLFAGKSLPWYLLGISNASGMFDISGKIWMVSIMFIYGLKSVFLVWLWPVFNQVFLFAYLAVWLRRSNVATGAEWILFRFGNRPDAQRSHKVIVAFALLSCLGFMAYGFIGLGKFIEIFIPFSYIQQFLPFSIHPILIPHFYGIVVTFFAMIYSVLGGLKSIVWADVIQYFLMAIGSVSIAIIAMIKLSENGPLPVPENWSNLFFGWNLNLDWSQTIPQINEKIKKDNFEPFGLFFTLMLTKGILASLAGPAPNYDMQKILASKSPRESALMSMFVNVVLLPTRYFMVIGFTVLGLLYFSDLPIQSPSGELDFEKILPATILKYAPSGLMGLFVVELMAAFMGTFAGTLNAAQAYVVNDIYLKSIKPNASNQQLKKVNYVVGTVVVFISICIGVYADNVNSILQWIVGALYGGYISANVLKWHWWRFNANGFFYGMLAGILSAMILPYVFDNMIAIYYFPIILLLSLLACIIGSLLSPATELDVLKNFYRQVKPWGFWKPVEQLVIKENSDFVVNSDFKKDMFNVLIGIIAQTSISVLPIFMVLLMPKQVLLSAVVLFICCGILYISWYKKLTN
jgi:solute:Na+ symporter, SSS family